VSTSTELSVERDYAASAQAVFDAYFSMHGDQRPDWIVDSQLDLRVGGTWKVTFHGAAPCGRGVEVCRG